MSNVTKALEWEEVEPGWFAVKRPTGSIIPPYEVRQARAGVRVRGMTDPFYGFVPFDGTIDEAKRACRQHFEALVNQVLA